MVGPAAVGLDNLVSALVPKGNDLYVASQLITGEA